MELIIVSTLIAFLLGISVGFFIGIKRKAKILSEPPPARKVDEKLRVFHKSEPKTHAEKQVEALEKEKPIIKTFYK